jgi:hypothetical protein
MTKTAFFATTAKMRPPELSWGLFRGELDGPVGESSNQQDCTFRGALSVMYEHCPCGKFSNQWRQASQVAGPKLIRTPSHSDNSPHHPSAL